MKWKKIQKIVLFQAGLQPFSMQLIMHANINILMKLKVRFNTVGLCRLYTPHLFLSVNSAFLLCPGTLSKASTTHWPYSTSTSM